MANRFYHSFAWPNAVNALLLKTAVLTLDPTISVIDRRDIDGRLMLGKATDWDSTSVRAAQTIIDSPGVLDSKALQNKQMVDRYPPEIQALFLVLLDQINILRTRATLPTITVTQALDAIRDRAGTL